MQEIEELKQMVQNQGQQIEKMLKMLQDGMIETNWLSETEALRLTGFDNAESFRRRCKSLDPEKKLPINYRHNNKRDYHYYKPDIDKYLLETSSLGKKKIA